MKTGEEKFDDEIRQKLRHSEVTPPGGFFELIIPPPDKRKGFLWIWIAGILLLGLTATIVKFDKEPNNYRHSSKKENTSSSASAAVNQTSGQGASNQNEVGSASEKSSPIASQVSTSETMHSQTSFDNNMAQHSSGRNEGENSTYRDYSNKNTSSASSTKRNKPESDNNVYYANRKTEGTTPIHNYDLLYIPVPSLPYDEKTSIKQQIRILKPDQTVFDPHTPTGFVIEVVLSKLIGYPTTTSENPDTVKIRLLNSISDSDAGSSGFDIGALCTYALNSKFTIRAGIHYSERKQDFNFNFEEFYDELDVDTLQYYILFPFTPPVLITEYDSTILHLSRTKNIEHHLVFKAVSVSADICYQVPAGRFLIEPQLGIIADVYSKIGGTTNFNTQFEQQNGETHFENSFQMRAKGGLQIGYSLSEKYNVFIQSEYQYALTSLKTKEEFYSVKTNILSLGAGIRYTIFKSQAAKP